MLTNMTHPLGLRPGTRNISHGPLTEAHFDEDQATTERKIAEIAEPHCWRRLFETSAVERLVKVKHQGVGYGRP
jgi:hypothetical protein